MIIDDNCTTTELVRNVFISKMTYRTLSRQGLEQMSNRLVLFPGNQSQCPNEMVRQECRRMMRLPKSRVYLQEASSAFSKLQLWILISKVGLVTFVVLLKIILRYEETVLRIKDSFSGSKVQQSLPTMKQTHYAYLCSGSLLVSLGLCSGPTHQALLSVLQRAHHGCCVPLLLFFLLQCLLPVLQLFLVQSELDWISCRPCP